MLSRHVVLVGSLALMAAPAHAVQDTTDAARIARIEQRLYRGVVLSSESDSGWSVRDRMRTAHVPGMSVAVVHGGRVAWTRAYGERDAVTHAPVTTATMFQAGSISKPLAAFTAVKLAEAGRLSLDADVNSALRRWQVPSNPFMATVTVTMRRLLTHQAGVNVRGFDGYRRGARVPTLLQILRGSRPANSPAITVDTTPGSINRYSGGGFMIAQAVMEDVTGRRFDVLADSLIIRPLDLRRTTYAAMTPTRNQGDVASGHAGDGARIAGRWRVLPEMAAASLWSTPTELATVLVALQTAARGEPSPMLSRTAAAQILTLHGPGQGLGIGLKGDPPYRFSHSGSNDGFQAQFIGYLDRGDGIVVMTNGDGGDALAMEYVRAVAREYGWSDLAPSIRTPVTLTEAQVAGLVGRYQLGPDWFIEVRTEAGRLVAGPAGRRLLPLHAESDSSFFFTDVDGVTLAVRQRQGAQVSEVLWTVGTRVTPGVRVPDAR